MRDLANLGINFLPRNFYAIVFAKVLANANCCICDGPETPLQKLVSATPRGYPALLGYAEAAGDVTVVERMKEARKVEKLTYHKERRRDLYNKSVKVIRKSTRK